MVPPLRKIDEWLFMITCCDQSLVRIVIRVKAECSRLAVVKVIGTKSQSNSKAVKDREFSGSIVGRSPGNGVTKIKQRQDKPAADWDLEQHQPTPKTSRRKRHSRPTTSTQLLPLRPRPTPRTILHLSSLSAAHSFNRPRACDPILSASPAPFFSQPVRSKESEPWISSPTFFRPFAHPSHTPSGPPLLPDRLPQRLMIKPGSAG
ncbi:hypothetical protein BDD12DRAFT_875527 [Trichophaea hybrida]|nr:hypothetical protein BDD12DRAFT_875527 [Trichophaea hybrida]